LAFFGMSRFTAVVRLRVSIFGMAVEFEGQNVVTSRESDRGVPVNPRRAAEVAPDTSAQTAPSTTIGVSRRTEINS
jgi:hypothetical protein